MIERSSTPSAWAWETALRRSVVGTYLLEQRLQAHALEEVVDQG